MLFAVGLSNASEKPSYFGRVGRLRTDTGCRRLYWFLSNSWIAAWNYSDFLEVSCYDKIFSPSAWMKKQKRLSTREADPLLICVNSPMTCVPSWRVSSLQIYSLTDICLGVLVQTHNGVWLCGGDWVVGSLEKQIYYVIAMLVMSCIYESCHRFHRFAVQVLWHRNLIDQLNSNWHMRHLFPMTSR
jgi:hypothetical protein